MRILSVPQVQLYAEFEVKERQLLEEQDKYKKVLEAELKRLKQEVSELMDGFEKKLSPFFCRFWPSST